MNVILLTDITDMPGYGKYAGVYRVATELRLNGFSVQVIDCFTHMNQVDLFSLVDGLTSTKTLAVGFSNTFLKRFYANRDHDGIYHGTNEVFIEMFDDIKISPFGLDSNFIHLLIDRIRSKGIKVIMGGSEDRTLYSEFSIDYFFYGQSDLSIIEYVKSLAENRNIKHRISSVGNFTQHVIHQDDFKFSEFNRSRIIWTPEDHIFQGESLPIEIARGCIFKCTYCNYQLNGKTKNEFVKDEQVLMQEMVRNWELFGVKSYIICDDLLNDSLDKVKMINRISKKLPFQLTFSSYLRLDMLFAFPEMIELLLEAGLRSCTFGIETLNDKSGRSVGKGLGKDRTLKTLKACKAVWKDQVRMISGFIVGLPYETIESLQETIEWLESDECLLDVVRLTPLMMFKSLDTTVQVLGQNANSLGYKNIRDGRVFRIWENEHMTYFDAMRIARDFYQKNRKRKWRYAGYSMYNRLLNLGLEENDLLYCHEENIVNTLADLKRKKYINNLFKSFNLTMQGQDKTHEIR